MYDSRTGVAAITSNVCTLCSIYLMIMKRNSEKYAPLKDDLEEICVFLQVKRMQDGYIQLCII